MILVLLAAALAAAATNPTAKATSVKTTSVKTTSVRTSSSSSWSSSTRTTTVMATPSASLVACQSDSICQSNTTQFAIEQLVLALRNAADPFSETRFTSNDTVAVVDQPDSLPPSDKATNFRFIGQFQNANGSVADAVAAMGKYANVQCNCTAFIALDNASNPANVSAPRFSIQAVTSPRAANCFNITSANNWPAYFCPPNFTQPGCSNLTANGCQVGPTLWTTPTFGQSNASLLQNMTRLIDGFRVLNNATTGNVTYNGTQQSVNETDVDIMSGHVLFRLPPNMSHVEVQQGLQYVGGSVAGHSSCWVAGQVQQSQQQVGEYNLTLSC